MRYLFRLYDQRKSRPVSPRPYQQGKRLLAIAETRSRIVRAARDLLTQPEGASTFTIDAVAQRADVARMTVYYQFKSKGGLLEALFEDLAERGQMSRLREAFANPEPLEALDEFVAAFVRFWNSDRLIVRRLNALAALDAEVERAMVERNGWRREGLTVLLKRIGRTSQKTLDILFMLTSFDTFDALATGRRTTTAVAGIIQQLAHSSLT